MGLKVKIFTEETNGRMLKSVRYHNGSVVSVKVGQRQIRVHWDRNKALHTKFTEDKGDNQFSWLSVGFRERDQQ